MSHKPWAYLWLGIALLLGACAIFWNLGGASLYLDEGWTVHVGSLPLPQLLHAVAHSDDHPPLFYLFSHALQAALHWQPWSYRYVTAPFGLLTIVATWAVARRSFGETTAAIAAVVVALEPTLIVWDRLFRMYVVLVALSATGWWLLSAAQTSRGRWSSIVWLPYGAIAIVLPYVHYLGGLMVLCQALYALTHRRRLWPALACAALSAIAFVPWSLVFREQFASGGLAVVGSHLRFDWLGLARMTLAAGTPAAWLPTRAFDWVLSAAAVALCVAGAWIGRRTLLPFWLIPVLVQPLAGFALHKSLSLPHYLLYVVPAVAIAAGAAATALLKTRARLVGAALVAGALALNVAALVDVLFVPYYQFSDWYQVNALLLSREKPDDRIILDQGFERFVVGSFSAFRGHPMFSLDTPVGLAAALQWVDERPAQRVWYVENQSFFPDPERRVFERLEHTRRRIGAWEQRRQSAADAVVVVLYGARRPAGRTNSVVTTTSP